MIDCTGILAARNRTKKRINDFRYEAMQNMMKAEMGSASEFSFACCALALRAMKKKMDFMTDKDELILNRLRMCIAHKK